MMIFGSRQHEQLRLEGEKLKRRILHLERFAAEPGARIALLYRLADNFGRRMFPHSLCGQRIGRHSGCETGNCCQCRPDVFAYEKQVLDLLPRRIDASGYCPFFNPAKRICGIYGVRPFACRIFYNTGSSLHACQNPADETLQLFDGLKRHVELVLGRYQGGYQPERKVARFPCGEIDSED